MLLKIQNFKCKIKYNVWMVLGVGTNPICQNFALKIRRNSSQHQVKTYWFLQNYFMYVS